MLLTHAHVDILLICIVSPSCYCDPANYINVKSDFNTTWTSIGWVIVPSNLADQCSHTCLMGGADWVYCHTSRRCLQLGKVIHVRYPDQVGRYKPCVPDLFARFCPRLGPFMFCHDGGCWVSWGDIEATHDLAQKRSWSEWPGECHAIDRFCRNAVGTLKWEYEAWVPWCRYNVLTSVECIIYR